MTRAVSTNQGRSHIVVVGAWLNDLAIMTAGNRPIEEQKVKVAVLTSVLADAFPDDAAFTKESLYAISRQCTFLPAFAELQRLLGDWWDAHKPRSFMVPVELVNAPLPGADRAAVQIWLQHHHAAELSDHDMIMRLAVIRQCNEPGYRWLIANNDRAKNIAYAQGWLHQINDPFDDPGRILASVRAVVDPPHPMANVLLAAVRAGVERDAPEYADLVPHTLAEHFGEDEPHAAIPSQAAMVRADDGVVRVDHPALVESTPPPTKPSRQLAPEHLAAARMNNPLLKAVAERQAAIEAERRLHDDDSARYALHHDKPIDLDETDITHDIGPSGDAPQPRSVRPLKPLVWEDV